MELKTRYRNLAMQDGWWPPYFIYRTNFNNTTTTTVLVLEMSISMLDADS